MESDVDSGDVKFLVVHHEQKGTFAFRRCLFTLNLQEGQKCILV